MRIVVSGPKASGKTTISRLLAERLALDWYETDAELERLSAEGNGCRRSFRDIWRDQGEEAFRVLERRAVEIIAAKGACVVGTGGSTLFDEGVRRQLCEGAFVVLVEAPFEVLWQRLQTDGLPAYLREAKNPRQVFAERVRRATQAVAEFANLRVDTGLLAPGEAAEEIVSAWRENKAERLR